MNKERISLMIKMLEEVKVGAWKSIKLNKTHFDKMMHLGGSSYKDQKIFDLNHWVAKTNSTPCGFSACAIGHATLDSRFRKLGLDFGHDGNPQYKDWDAFEAVTDFFKIGLVDENDSFSWNIDEDQVSYILFSPNYYPENQKGNALVEQVIRRLKILLEVGETSFVKKFGTESYSAARRMVTPNLRVYNQKLKEVDVAFFGY